MVWTNWRYDTGSEDALSVGLASFGSGTLRLVNTVTSNAFTVDYTFFGLGPSRGADLGVSTSNFSTASGAIGDSRVSRVPFSPEFGPANFPSTGRLLTMGGSLCVGGNGDYGLSVCLWDFGLGAEMYTWGRFSSALPGVGLCVALCVYHNVTEIRSS
jgi:hypothetical protein